MKLRDYIFRDPKIFDGQPVIKGTETKLITILGMLALGASPDQIVKDFPNVSLEVVNAVIAYAASLAELDLLNSQPPSVENDFDAKITIALSEWFNKEIPVSSIDERLSVDERSRTVKYFDRNIKYFLIVKDLKKLLRDNKSKAEIIDYLKAQQASITNVQPDPALLEKTASKLKQIDINLLVPSPPLPNDLSKAIKSKKPFWGRV